MPDKVRTQLIPCEMTACHNGAVAVVKYVGVDDKLYVANLCKEHRNLCAERHALQYEFYFARSP